MVNYLCVFSGQLAHDCRHDHHLREDVEYCCFYLPSVVSHMTVTCTTGTCTLRNMHYMYVVYYPISLPSLLTPHPSLLTPHPSLLTICISINLCKGVEGKAEAILGGGEAHVAIERRDDYTLL